MLIQATWLVNFPELSFFNQIKNTPRLIWFGEGTAGRALVWAFQPSPLCAVDFLDSRKPREDASGTVVLYLSAKQCAADRTQQELIRIPPQRKCSPRTLRYRTKMAACHGCDWMWEYRPPLIRNWASLCFLNPQVATDIKKKKNSHCVHHSQKLILWPGDSPVQKARSWSKPQN